MTRPSVYLWFPGNAQEALTFYQNAFGGETIIHTFADFGRLDGPPSAIAHGMLRGPVTLYCTDAVEGEDTLLVQGLSIALLGTSDAETLHRWFDALAEGGEILDPLSPKPWNASDGQVVDKFGLRWLIGYENS